VVMKYLPDGPSFGSDPDAFGDAAIA